MNRLVFTFFMFVFVSLFLVFFYQTKGYVSPGVTLLPYKDVSQVKQANFLSSFIHEQGRRTFKKLHQDSTFHTLTSKAKRIKAKALVIQPQGNGTDVFSIPNTSRTISKPKVIIILARMRTGSTFAGEIFNQNPDAFFLFEPLHSEDKYIRANRYINSNWREKPTSLLKSLSECHFTDQYILDIRRWGLGRVKSSGLGPVCKKTNKCKTAEGESLSDWCNNFDYLVLKLIRGDLKMIEPLVTRYNLDIKIIHLMRDPRGTAASRKSYYGKEGTSVRLRNLYLLMEEPPKKVNTVPQLCRWIKDTTSYAMKRPDWLKGRYKMVRYEDLAVEPMRLSRDIYNFLDIDLNEKVKRWILENTEVENGSKNKFSTQRNSTATATSWRHRLTFEEVKQVQSLCGGVMGVLGYDLVQSERDLSDEHKQVFHPLNVGDDISLT